MKQMKQIAFWVMVGIIVIYTFGGGATFLQMIPVAIFLYLSGQDIWGKMNYKTFIVVLSAIMLVINLTMVSWVDVFIWGAIIAIWSYKEMEVLR